MVRLTQRIQFQLRMIWHNVGFQRNKLANDGIVEWGSPVGNAEDMRRQPDGHRSGLHALFEIRQESITGSDWLVSLLPIVNDLGGNDAVQEVQKPISSVDGVGFLSGRISREAESCRLWCLTCQP